MDQERLRVAILDDFEGWLDVHPAIAALRARAEITVFREPLGDGIAQSLAGFHAVCLVRERTAFPAALIESLPALRYLAFTGARNPSCDQQAAAARAIAVSNTAGGPSKRSTAELAWALAMAADKQLVAADAGMRAGRWRADAQGRAYPLPGILEGRTLGLLGLGEIGSIMAGFGRAFGMRVIAWSPNLTDERAARGGAERVARQELFEQSDVLSLHMVLADSTRGIVGARDLAAMKPGSILVNTSRAGLIDMAALPLALQAGRPGHAALDVFEHEPVVADDPLLGLARLTLAPHLGYVNDRVFEIFATGLAEVITGWIEGRPVRVVNGVGVA
ncbi:MAG: D-2-hydroxyacid dehydrogenase family protein [Burkholderiaceae bacterium]